LKVVLTLNERWLRPLSKDSSIGWNGIGIKAGAAEVKEKPMLLFLHTSIFLNISTSGLFMITLTPYR